MSSLKQETEERWKQTYISYYTEQRIDVLVQCGQCLQKLHDIGVVHRDVKPENFLLSKDADCRLRVVICDFGLSTVVDSNAKKSNVGTTSYKAPEVVQNRCQRNLAKKVIDVLFEYLNSMSILLLSCTSRS